MRQTAAMALLFLFAAPAAAFANPPDVVSDHAASANVSALIVESAALRLPVRVERAFLLTLRAAADALQEGEVARAQTLLRTFTFEVRSVKRAKRIPAESADPLIEKAERLIATMSGPALR
jgi:hypothetical protein